jgi:hypothetical protein
VARKPNPNTDNFKVLLLKKNKEDNVMEKKILKHVNINPVVVIGIHRQRKNRFSLMLKNLECFRPANNMAVQIGRFIYGWFVNRC